MQPPQLMLTPPRQCRMLQEKPVHSLLLPRTRMERVVQTHLEALALGPRRSLRLGPLEHLEHPDFKQGKNPFHRHTRQGLSKKENSNKQTTHH